MPRHRWRELVVACGVAGCGWLPADTPPVKPAAAPPEALVVHAWKVVDHVLATGAAMTESDAHALHGRTVEVRTAGYTSPWHGTCEDAGRQRRKRVLADVTLEADVTAQGRQRIARFGFETDLVEFKLSCNDPDRRSPAITIYVAKDRAMTCFGGVCYLLAR